METTYHFMVDFTLPEVLTEDFMNQIPFQRATVDRFFKEGKLVNYSLSLENSKIWAVFNANSDSFEKSVGTKILFIYIVFVLNSH